MLYWINQFAVLPDQPGGTRHFEMSRELVRRELPTTVVASDLNLTRRSYLRRTGPRDQRYLREQVEGVEFVWLPAGHYQANDWRRALSMVIFAVHVLWFLLRAPMPQGTVVVGSSPHLLAAGTARLAAAIRRVPFVLEVRDLWPESLQVAGERPGLMYRTLRVLADLLYRTSPAIVVLAAGNADRIAERGVPRERISYIPNGVDTSAFVDAVPSGLPPAASGKQALIYAGAHGPANGLDVVLDAAEQLQRWRTDDVQLVLVGDGPVKSDLIAAAKARGLHNVTFLDAVSKSEIPGLMKSCAGGLMPLADVELFSYGVSPNKLFDYLSAELPVVTNVPGDVARMVTESGAGIVVPPADPEAMAEAIRTIASGQTRFTSGLAWIREHHDRASLAAAFRELVLSVAGGAKVSRVRQSRTGD